MAQIRNHPSSVSEQQKQALLTRIATSTLSVNQLIALCDTVESVGDFGNVIISICHHKAKNIRVERTILLPE